MDYNSIRIEDGYILYQGWRVAKLLNEAPAAIQTEAEELMVHDPAAEDQDLS